VGYGAMSLGDWCPLFLTQNGGFIFRGWRIGPLQMTPPAGHSPSGTAPYPRRTKALTLPLWKPIKTFICSVTYFFDRGSYYIPWVNVVTEHANFQHHIMHISFKLPPPPILTIWAIMYHPYAVKLLIVV